MAATVRIAADAVGEGKSLAIDAGGRSILVCRSSGAVHAVDNRCTHAQSRLQGGKLREGVITCPLHGARFDLATGRCLAAALGYAPLATFAVREEEGVIEVDVIEVDVG